MCRWICVCLRLLQLCMPALSLSINHHYRWQVCLYVCERVCMPCVHTNCRKCSIRCSTGCLIVTASMLRSTQFPRFPRPGTAVNSASTLTHARRTVSGRRWPCAVMRERLINSVDCLRCLHKVARTRLTGRLLYVGGPRGLYSEIWPLQSHLTTRRWQHQFSLTLFL